MESAEGHHISYLKENGREKLFSISLFKNFFPEHWMLTKFKISFPDCTFNRDEDIVTAPTNFIDDYEENST